MKRAPSHLGFVAQNVILGTITGTMVAYNLRILYQRIGVTDLIWVMFFLMGPMVGFLSGRERQRLERMKKEKTTLRENLDKIQSALKKSTKKYQLLVEYANDAIYLTTEAGRFILFNEATCLLSGYSKDELGRMPVSQLKAEDGVDEKHRKSWLDNGYCRYEEKWLKKNGDVVPLDINARWIRLGKHRLILHVSRNITRWKEEDQEENARMVRRYQESRYVEMASVQRALLSRVLSPVTDTVSLLHSFLKKYPDDVEQFSGLLSEWGSTRKLLQDLTTKNFRDFKSTPCRWDLNEILKQELNYLDVVTDFGGFIKQTSLTPNLPAVFGFGRDFSISFHTVLRAIMESMKNSDRREMTISTRLLGDHILVEIQTASEVSFQDHLCRIIDPYYDRDDSTIHGKTDVGLLICRLLFESFGAKMDVGEQENGGTLIRIRVPIVETEAADARVQQVVSTESVII
jgi:PAS domain S-box-containing protein